MLENKFYKVGMSGGSYIVALLYNPVTHETKTRCARDYDYSDCSRDDDELYYMPIDEEARTAYRKHLNSLDGGHVEAGDVVEVVKGRKVKIGTVGKVVRVYDWMDCYKRVQATYAVLEDGQKTSVYNCRIVG